MTNEEITQMACEAGFVLYDMHDVDGEDLGESIESDDYGALFRFAALVAAKEREACAAVAEKTVCDTHIPTGIKIYGARAAKAIRAIGKQ